MTQQTTIQTHDNIDNIISNKSSLHNIQAVLPITQIKLVSYGKERNSTGKLISKT